MADGQEVFLLSQHIGMLLMLKCPIFHIQILEISTESCYRRDAGNPGPPVGIFPNFGERLFCSADAFRTSASGSFSSLTFSELRRATLLSQRGCPNFGERPDGLPRQFFALAGRPTASETSFSPSRAARRREQGERMISVRRRGRRRSRAHASL